MSIAFSAVTRSKTLASMFAAALIMGGGTAAAAAATGTNPLAFAQQIPVVVQHVPAAVVDCKDQLGSGHHGVGECVSTFVQANRPDSTNTGSTTKLISPSSSAAPSASTHGSEVSTVARSTAPGPEHGEAVSTVARSDGQASASASPTGTRGQPDNLNAASGRSVAATAQAGRTGGEARGEAVSSAARSNKAALPSPATTPTPPADVTPAASRPGNAGGAPGRREGAFGR